MIPFIFNQLFLSCPVDSFGTPVCSILYVYAFCNKSSNAARRELQLDLFHNLGLTIKWKMNLFWENCCARNFYFDAIDPNSGYVVGNAFRTCLAKDSASKRKLIQIDTDYRALHWLNLLKHSDGLVSRLEKVAFFEYEIVQKIMHPLALCPSFPIKTPPETGRIHLNPMQMKGTQRRITTKQVRKNDRTFIARARKGNRPYTRKSKPGSNCSNKISIRMKINRREVNKVLILCR